ncbi:MAG: hypothetical protein PHD04_00140 [Candidatus Pacebacteria bacterium]|nr:hypothetical protein [Candidatus Paceibacterota bacterium]
MKIFKEHDNRDRDVIIINKDSLVLRLFRSKEFYNSSNSAFGFGGIAFASLSTGYLTETFRDIGYIPGETIRSIFIVLGIITLVLAVRSVFRWYKLKNGHEPEEIVRSLLNHNETPKTFPVKGRL